MKDTWAYILGIAIIVGCWLLSPYRYIAIINPNTPAVWVLDRSGGEVKVCFKECRKP